MKAVFAVVLCSLLGSAFGANATDAQQVDWVVKCALRAAYDGIEGLVPGHNPLWIENLNLTQSVLGVEYHFELTNNILYSLMDLNITQEDVTSYQNPEAINIDYDIYWPILNFTGDFAWSASIFGLKVGGNGTYNIVLHHTDFIGLFYYIKAGQSGVEEQVSNFTLAISVKDVESHITGGGPGWLTDNVLNLALEFGLNHVPESAGEFLRVQRFNEFWIGHHERIDQVINWCNATALA